MNGKILWVTALLWTACSAGGGGGGGGGGVDGGSGGVDGGGGSGDGGSDGAVGPSGPAVDPSCTDGQYSETLPNVTATISDVSFSAADVTGYYDTVLGRRYQTGAELVAGGLTNTQFGNCVSVFSGNPTSVSAAMKRIEVVVHECGHLYDGKLGSGSTNAYYLTSATTLSCSRGDTTSRGGDTFARSRIRGDAYQPSLKPCSETGNVRPCDSYADIYLDGDPDDTTFDGGDQGFNMLFEETNQYVHSLATAWSFVDQMAQNQRTSARDGILTFLWYVERYLHMARLDYPSAYSKLSGDACWRDAILTVWGRAWLYLDATKSVNALGIDDDKLESLVMTPDLLDEIERLRTAAGCP